MKKTITYIDPPEGWAYGFPKIYTPKEDQSCEDWLVENGYPRDMAEMGWPCRFWQEEVDIDDEA